ncbi:LysR family transcriptional regulator [Streptomyces violaceusniger]|uniref:Transcriptional regulator, LysR family n=1 Tax=Streptomyces violaceusniger (strain Tu 4113) TaxID=653045 RepID=G2NZ20_STRV4|nr:LysR family transcriptional regulator [Streptomyces violaceusniger]AEM82914.1 transcriptional regulator, LysR family [Streptomyces violaceusniger Tu 4113]
MPDDPPSSADLDLRLVRYFTVVAEHRNFHRAADALHLAQPSLSRQIQRLEERMGVRLLHRTKQGSHLTEAGRIFLPQAQALLDSARHAVATTRAAVGPEEFTIGYTGSLIVTTAARALRDRRPDAEVHTLHLDFGQVQAALLDHRVDVVLAREPFPTGQLRVAVLYEEPRVLVVPAFHRLAGRTSVTLDDFADEALVRYPDAAYDAFWRLDPRPDGRPAPDGPLVVSAVDKLELIAGGRALALAPSGSGHHPLRHDLTTIPVAGIAPCRVVVASRAEDRGPLVADFLGIAVRQLARPRQHRRTAVPPATDQAPFT